MVIVDPVNDRGFLYRCIIFTDSILEGGSIGSDPGSGSGSVPPPTSIVFWIWKAAWIPGTPQRAWEQGAFCFCGRQFCPPHLLSEKQRGFVPGSEDFFSKKRKAVHWDCLEKEIQGRIYGSSPHCYIDMENRKGIVDEVVISHP